jgi:hypothetical protein
MNLLLTIALASQTVPAGELSTNERLVESIFRSIPTSFETDRQGSLQLFFLADPQASYVVHVSPPSPYGPSPPNVTVVVTDPFDERKERFPADAGVVADDGSVILTPLPRRRPGEAVRYSANLGNDTVRLLEKVWDAALVRAHTHYRTARPQILFDGFLLCIRDDIPGHNDVIACVSSPMEGTTGAHLYHLGKLLFQYAEDPLQRRLLLRQEIRAAAEGTLKFITENPAPPVRPEP